ncbi:MAG TPA: TIGR03084 family metal-binding protein [Microbacteriaceae bacterium]|nr:TIGR03084 family metal-binding protein [Microbacteriaceae bacterium]
MAVDREARYAELLDDLRAEAAELDALLVGLSPAEWRLDTQSRGWSIAHQVGHLELTERLMWTAMTDEPEFRRLAPITRTRPELSAGELARPDVGVRRLVAWRDSRTALLGVFAGWPGATRMPWVGPSMSFASAATSRIMEIWAHGEDVYQAVGATRAPTRRLRHIAHLAVAARDYSFRNRGLVAPAEPFRVEVQGPDGEVWSWGPEDAPQRVTGDAYDVALLATRRVHRSDSRVVAVGRDAVRWLRTMQAYAGPPGPRRRPTGVSGGASVVG